MLGKEEDNGIDLGVENQPGGVDGSWEAILMILGIIVKSREGG